MFHRFDMRPWNGQIGAQALETLQACLRVHLPSSSHDLQPVVIIGLVPCRSQHDHMDATQTRNLTPI